MPNLQYVILALGLVNQIGRETIYKLINLRLKYLNRSYKIKIKYSKNLTYNVNIIFNQVYIINTQIRALYKKIEAMFSKYMPSTYIIASIVLDIFLLTQNIFTRDLAKL